MKLSTQAHQAQDECAESNRRSDQQTHGRGSEIVVGPVAQTRRDQDRADRLAAMQGDGI